VEIAALSFGSLRIEGGMVVTARGGRRGVEIGVAASERVRF